MFRHLYLLIHHTEWRTFCTPTTMNRKPLGRPPKEGIDTLKTQVWAHWLMQVSSLHSGHALELELEPDLCRPDDAGIRRTNKWTAYVKGRRVPSRMAGRPFSVDVAEARFPGTKAVFDSPAWRFLAGERLTVAEIDAGICAFGPVVSTWVPGIGGRPTSKSLPDFDARCAKALAGLGNIEALLALVLLIAKADTVASPDLREIALTGYWSIQPLLSAQEVLAPVLPSLFLAIDVRGKHWAHPSNQTRIDIVIFSEATREGLDAEAHGGTPLIRTVKTTPKTRVNAAEMPPGTLDYFSIGPTAGAAASTATQRQRERVKRKK